MLPTGQHFPIVFIGRKGRQFSMTLSTVLGKLGPGKLGLSLICRQIGPRTFGGPFCRFPANRAPANWALANWAPGRLAPANWAPANWAPVIYIFVLDIYCQQLGPDLPGPKLLAKNTRGPICLETLSTGHPRATVGNIGLNIGLKICEFTGLRGGRQRATAGIKHAWSSLSRGLSGILIQIE